MGCLSSVNLSVSKDKKDFNNNPLNKTELESESYEEHSCKINEDKNKVDNYNINNIPFDILKSYQFYYKNNNYKSFEIGKEEDKKNKKITLLKLYNKKSNDNNEIKNNNKNLIEDMDIDINKYKNYIIKDGNKKKDEQLNKIKENNKNDIFEGIDDNLNNIIINNSLQKSDIKKNESKVLRKSIEERITKYNIKKNQNQENNKDIENSICNLGKSYNNSL